MFNSHPTPTVYSLLTPVLFYSDYVKVCGPYSEGVWNALTRSAHCAPWVTWGYLNALFHCMWVGALFICQCYQVRNSLLYFASVGRFSQTVSCFILRLFQKLANEVEFRRQSIPLFSAIPSNLF